MTDQHDDNGAYALSPDLEPSRPRQSRPVVARSDGPELKCPDCGYDLRGLPFDENCPECGLAITAGALRRAVRQREGTPLGDQPWFWPTLLLVGGVLGGAIIAGLVGWMGGEGVEGAISMFVLFGIELAASVVVGWIVFFAFSMMWIGFTQPIPITVLQVGGVYATATAASMLFSMVPVPLIGWMLSVGVLLGLLIKVLDVDGRDAAIIATVSFVVKVVLVMIVMMVAFSL